MHVFASFTIINAILAAGTLFAVLSSDRLLRMAAAIVQP